MKKETVPETAYRRSVPAQNGQTQPGGLTPGQAIVMTGWAGAEGAAILAEEREDELKSIFPGDLVDEAKAYGDRRSNLSAETVAAQCGASAVYQISGEGVFGALWEMAAAAGCGLEADLPSIPIRQETIEICEHYRINPYLLRSAGCLLIGCDDGVATAEALRGAGIPAAVIGRAKEGKARVVKNRGETRYLTPPGRDPLPGMSVQDNTENGEAS